MRRPERGYGEKSAVAPIASPAISPPSEVSPTMRQGWQSGDVQDQALVQAVLTPNEMMRTDTQSRPVITLMSGTIPLSTTFATQMRLHMIALTRITN
jgi:hypothetical protein